MCDPSEPGPDAALHNNQSPGLDVQLIVIHFDLLGWNRASGHLTLNLTNNTSHNIGLTHATIRLTLSPVTKLRTLGSIALTLAPNESRTVDLPLAFSPANLGYNAFALLSNNDAEFHLAADVLTELNAQPQSFNCENHGVVQLTSP